MVKGLDTFQKYFADYEEQYVLIGGAACDILFESNEVMLMCDKVTHKKLIDSNLLFRKISRNLLSKMIQYNSKKIFF